MRDTGLPAPGDDRGEDIAETAEITTCLFPGSSSQRASGPLSPGYSQLRVAGEQAASHPSRWSPKWRQSEIF